MSERVTHSLIRTIEMMISVHGALKARRGLLAKAGRVMVAFLLVWIGAITSVWRLVRRPN